MDVQPRTPLTVVKILSGVPIDNSYTDQLDFPDASTQYNYFNGKTKYTFSGLTPVRMQNAIRIPKPADNLYNCNYVMFQNANFGNKWFYAFIDSIDFINVNDCLVHFSLDVWQTWQFDITIHNSFVERQHVINDGIGVHTIPENLEIGEIVSQDQQPTRAIGSEGTNRLHMFVSKRADGSTPEPVMYDGMFYATRFYYSNADKDGATELGNTIKNYNDGINDTSVDDIISIVELPDMKGFSGGGYDSKVPMSKTVNIPKKYDTVSGWKPKNNKLYTYPYNYLIVSNIEGTEQVMRYEDFSDNENCEFIVYALRSPSPEVWVMPVRHLKKLADPDNAVLLTNFPQVPFVTDTYKAWLAQNGNSLALSALGGAINIGAGVALGNPGAFASGATQISNTLLEMSQQAKASNRVHGAQTSGITTACFRKDIYFIRVGVKFEYARIIDNFFSMYGYQINRLKNVNYKTRPYWNYIKTADVKITGSVPFGDMARIKQMFNNGVTMWHDDDVGNYDRDNSTTYTGGED